MSYERPLVSKFTGPKLPGYIVVGAKYKVKMRIMQVNYLCVQEICL